jgi:hypothetical protein
MTAPGTGVKMTRNALVVSGPQLCAQSQAN